MELLKDLGMMYPTEFSKEKKRFGLYVCSCGKQFKVQTQSVKNGKTVSCGCYKNKIHTTHGLKNHRLYHIWNSMVQRCNNKNHKQYSHYGARGITIGNEWLNIENFINDMYPTFKHGLSIDRIDNDNGYSKDNCRWTTNKVQNRNTRMLCKNNTSGYRGVYFDKKLNKFRSRITVNNKKIHLGLFDTAIEAGKSYNDYVIKNNLEHTINKISEVL